MVHSFEDNGRTYDPEVHCPPTYAFRPASGPLWHLRHEWRPAAGPARVDHLPFSVCIHCNLLRAAHLDDGS